jgi:hypothetical protein
VLVGGTSAGQDGAVTLSNTGYIQARIDNDTVAYFDRTGSGDDGEVIRIQQNGATVGSIGSVSTDSDSVSDLYIGGDNTGIRLGVGADVSAVVPCLQTTGALRNGVTNLGASNARFKDLHLSANAYTENVLVGKTSLTGVSTAGVELRSDGIVIATKTGGISGYFGRNSSDGDIINFYKDNSVVGSIQSRGSTVTTLILDPRTNGVGISGTANAIIPTSNAGAIGDANTSLSFGAAGYRFQDLYLSGGVYLGGTGSANKLDEYEEGLWSPGLKGASSGDVATLTSATKGSYVKIGNQVTVNFIVVSSSIGSASGTVQITGLPFTVAAPLTTTGIQGNGTAGYWQGFATAVNNIVYTAEANTNLMYVYATTSGTQNSISGLQINQMGAAAVRGTLTYRST